MNNKAAEAPVEILKLLGTVGITLSGERLVATSLRRA
jgi:hypothetical protein